MPQDSYNIIPVTLAVLLHVVVFGSMFVAFDFNRDMPPPMPLAIKATLVTEDTPAPRPPPVVQQPEPEPEPEPVIEEPEPEIQQPDPQEEARRKAEELKRLEDAQKEQERRKAEEDARIAREKKAAEDEARRKREAEEEAERVRQQLEREREENIRRQREENERLEREAREAQIQEEEDMLAAQNSTEAQVYQALIIQKVRRNWARPGTARDDLECIVAVQQIPGGEVISARVTRCNGDEIVQRSVEAAVMRASPLPQPENPLLFLRNFQITFTIDE